MEFLIKHPIITYLIVNEICVTIKSIACRRYEHSMTDGILDGVYDGLQRGMGAEENDNESKAKIGFRVA